MQFPFCEDPIEGRNVDLSSLNIQSCDWRNARNNFASRPGERNFFMKFLITRDEKMHQNRKENQIKLTSSSPQHYVDASDFRPFDVLEKLFNKNVSSLRTVKNVRHVTHKKWKKRIFREVSI